MPSGVALQSISLLFSMTLFHWITQLVRVSISLIRLAHTGFVFRLFSPVAGVDWSMHSSAQSVSIAHYPLLQLHQPHVILNRIFPLLRWSSPSSLLPTSIVKTLPTSVSSPLLNTCQNQLRQCFFNHSSIDSTPTLFATSTPNF